MFLKKGQKWYQEEEVASEYDSSRFTGGGKVLDKKEKDMLLSLIEPEDKFILDIATGTGRFAELLSKRGGKVVGLDASREMLSKGRADYLQGDALNLPFSDKTFDFTISMRFIHLLEPEDIDVFVQEVERVTKDKFVFETLHPLSLRILYQWALPQDSRLYSNSFLKNRFNEMECVKKVNYYENFLVPYGIYQLLPEDVAKGVTKVDKHVVKRHEWLASTVYWELHF